MFPRLIFAAAAISLAAGAAHAQDQKKPSVTEAAGSLGGSVAGTVVGTTVGGPVGAVVGSTVGGAVGQTAGKVVHKVVHRKKNKSDGAEQQIARADTAPAIAPARGAVAEPSTPIREDRAAPPQPTPTPEDDSTTYRPKTDDAPKPPGL